MDQFRVNTHRFDPYRNFKFSFKLDGRNAAGVEQSQWAEALDRTHHPP